MQGNYTSINWANSSNFAGYVYDNNIYTITGEQIGVNLAKYQEVESALMKCKNRLIELGEIKVPKTPEEIIKEQTEMLEKQSLAITQLLEKVNEYQHNTQLPPAEYQGEHQSSITTSVTESGPDNNKNKGGRPKRNTKSGDSTDSSEQG